MADHQRTTHGTAQLIGLSLLAGTLVFVVVMSAFVLDLTEDLVFLITVMAVAVIGALVVWRFDALWSRIVGIVVTLAVFMTTFWFAFGIFAPFSPLEFVVGIAYAIGVILSLVGGVMAIVAGRRCAHPSLGPHGEGHGVVGVECERLVHQPPRAFIALDGTLVELAGGPRAQLRDAQCVVREVRDTVAVEGVDLQAQVRIHPLDQVVRE